MRRVAVGFSVVLMVWALAWLMLPGVLKNQLETRLTAQLGRKVSVGGVDFKPWSLELTLHDVAVAHAADASAQLAIKRVYIDMELQSLLRLAPVADAIQVESPQLRLTYLGAGRYDVDDVLARLNQAPRAAPSKPLGFALYNLALSQGQITLDDAAAGQVHQLTGLTIKLPFLSNLDSQRTVQVQPQLAFQLNGSQFDSAAQGTPFAADRKTDLHFKLQHLNLGPYLAYWPATLPLRLSSAVLDADLKLAFAQMPHTSLGLSGQVTASQVKLVDARAGAASGQQLLAFDALQVQLDDVRPLERKLQLGHVVWRKPQLAVQRNAQGVFNWQDLLAANKPPRNAMQNRADSPEDTRATSQKDQKDSTWSMAVTQFDLQDGALRWQDASMPKPAQLTLQAVHFSAHQLQWPVQQPVPFEGRAQLETAALWFKGQATDLSADVTGQLTDVPLRLAKAYLAGVLTPDLNGVLNADLGLHWQAAQSAKEPMQLTLQLPQLTLDKLVLTQKAVKDPLVSLKQLQLAQLNLDWSHKTATLGQVRLTQPQATLARLADGRFMFEDWLQPPDQHAATVPQGHAKPWQWTVNDLRLTQGRFNLSDASMPKPVALTLANVALQLNNFTSQGPQPTGWQLSARLHHGDTEPGHLSGHGTLRLNPLALQADVTAQRLPLHALQPYLETVLKVDVLRADASFHGHVNLAQKPQGLALQLHGDTQLEDVRADTLVRSDPYTPAEELLSWKELHLTGLDLSLTPAAAARVDVAQTVLRDFYARLTLSEAGRLNLQDVLVSSTGEPQAAPEVHVGPISLMGGRVDFTDRFIKPNYSARLSDLTGKLSAFSSQMDNGPVQLADLELRGRAEGTATLEILGKVNPLAKPLALDITGHVRDLELAPLSTYAAHYAGYGIERGKLNVDVAYKVQPDGQLNASNNIVLHQLQFGDPVPGAANSLPVKLAVALLADRNGVIDINLPVSGSLNDPQFRVGPLVFKLIVNLIVKAITAPFSLLASAFGDGGDELSTVSFAAGSATLTPEAQAGLDKVAKALLQRPALKMTVVGSASLEAEREAFKREQLQALVQAEKRRTQKTEGAGALQPVSAAEYPALLKAVYKRADFPKPRNLIGLTKDLPVADMQALLLANLAVSEAAMQELALRRGVAVRDHLANLKLPLDRLFLGAAKTVKPEAAWRPRAELHLATQ